MQYPRFPDVSEPSTNGKKTSWSQRELTVNRRRSNCKKSVRDPTSSAVDQRKSKRLNEGTGFVDTGMPYTGYDSLDSDSDKEADNSSVSNDNVHLKAECSSATTIDRHERLKEGAGCVDTGWVGLANENVSNLSNFDNSVCVKTEVFDEEEETNYESNYSVCVKREVFDEEEVTNYESNFGASINDGCDSDNNADLQMNIYFEEQVPSRVDSDSNLEVKPEAFCQPETEELSHNSNNIDLSKIKTEDCFAQIPEVSLSHGPPEVVLSESNFDSASNDNAVKLETGFGDEGSSCSTLLPSIEIDHADSEYFSNDDDDDEYIPPCKVFFEDPATKPPSIVNTYKSTRGDLGLPTTNDTKFARDRGKEMAVCLDASLSLGCECDGRLSADFEQLEGVLPRQYSYRICEWLQRHDGSFTAKLRTAVDTVELLNEWKAEFEQLTRCTFRTTRTYPNCGRKNVFKILGGAVVHVNGDGLSINSNVRPTGYQEDLAPVDTLVSQAITMPPSMGGHSYTHPSEFAKYYVVHGHSSTVFVKKTPPAATTRSRPRPSSNYFGMDYARRVIQQDMEKRAAKEKKARIAEHGTPETQQSSTPVLNSSHSHSHSHSRSRHPHQHQQGWTRMESTSTNGSVRTREGSSSAIGKSSSAVDTRSGKSLSAVDTRSGKSLSAVGTRSGNSSSAEDTRSGKSSSAVDRRSGKISSAVDTRSGKSSSAVDTRSGKSLSAEDTRSGRSSSAVEKTSSSSQIQSEGIQTHSGLTTFKCSVCARACKFYFRLNLPASNQKVEIKYTCPPCQNLTMRDDGKKNLETSTTTNTTTTSCLGNERTRSSSRSTAGCSSSRRMRGGGTEVGVRGSGSNPNLSFSYMISKTGRKSYKCLNCEDTFPTQWELKNHLEGRHSHARAGEKLYGCPVCKKTFSTSKRLRRHIQTHSYSVS